MGLGMEMSARGARIADDRPSLWGRFFRYRSREGKEDLSNIQCDNATAVSTPEKGEKGPTCFRVGTGIIDGGHGTRPTTSVR